ncbi:MAG: hypothetical protein K8J08_11680 [Thermoanaerobaculia bacterium]|nr:hypothetical protein [Thermoanaerobaculia bacterium]
MSTSPRLEFEHRQGAEPLRPAALATPASNAGRLLTALGRRPREHLRELRGIASAQSIFVLGEEDRLPWFPGVTYLGHPLGSSALLIPTWATLSLPGDIAEETLRLQLGISGPVALLPSLGLEPPEVSGRVFVCSLSLACRLDPEGLELFTQALAYLPRNPVPAE